MTLYPVTAIKVRWVMLPGPVGWTVFGVLAFILAVSAGVDLRMALWT